MRTEPETAAYRGMTCRAVTLGMARGARLEALSRGLPVPQAEAAERVVVAGLADPPVRDESRLLVAALAELGRIVAVAAVRLSRESGTRVSR